MQLSTAKQRWSARDGFSRALINRSYPDYNPMDPQLLSRETITKILKQLQGRYWTGLFIVNLDIAEQLIPMEVSGNRGKSIPQVRKIARDLTQGQFDICCDCYAITSTGEVANGNHRNHSFIRAAKEIRDNPQPGYVKVKDLEILVPVFFNYPVDALDITNSGKTIRIHEAATVSGTLMTSRQAAITRRLLTGIDHRCVTGFLPSNREVKDMFLTCQEVVKMVEHHVFWGPYHFTGAQMNELAIILMRSRLQSRPVTWKHIETFVNILRTGGHDHSEEQKQVCRFGSAIDHWKQFKDANRHWLYALIDRAFYNYVNGVETEKIPLKPCAKDSKVLSRAAERVLDNTLTPLSEYRELFQIS